LLKQPRGQQRRRGFVEIGLGHECRFVLEVIHSPPGLKYQLATSEDVGTGGTGPNELGSIPSAHGGIAGGGFRLKVTRKYFAVAGATSLVQRCRIQARLA
jgi:hypothetical protein